MVEYAKKTGEKLVGEDTNKGDDFSKMQHTRMKEKYIYNVQYEQTSDAIASPYIRVKEKFKNKKHESF